MPLFDYKAKDGEGNFVSGVIEAETEEVASDLIDDQGLFLIGLDERKSGFLSGSMNLDLFEKVKPKEIVIFSRQLSVMITATVPILQALRILIKQTEGVQLKRVISEVADDVDAGTKFSIALAKHPKIFDDFFINMIKSGETSGKLGDVLNFLADQLEKDYDLTSRIKGAMIYPAFIMFGLLVVGVIMMVAVVPKITDLVRGIGAELPLATRILIGISDFLVNYWWLVAFGTVGLIVGFRYYIGTESGRRLFDYLSLKLPVFGNLFQKIYLVRFTRGLATLIVGKVPLTVSLGVVGGIVQNTVYKDLIEKTIQEVEDGNSISTVFAKNKFVPTMLSSMMSVGEQTGRLEEVLLKMTDFYSREIDNLVTNLVSLIEPLILIIMGVAVGGMVAAILMPMFNLASQL